jgi:uncharacterized protein
MSKTNEQTMMPKHGEFCWMELHSKNVEECKQFYSTLFGWNLNQSQSVPDFDYTEFGTGEERKGGMFQMGAEFGDAPSHWMAYIAVDDVDETARQVEALGGKVCVPPSDIPNVGRFSVLNDPSGAVISILTMK